MSNRLTNIIAAFLLIFVFAVAIFSMKGDSVTMDEVAHLPAGYSYLTQKDMRLNPEHPPLLKDLAALPVLFIKGINFPSEIKDWQEDVNGQWGFGFHFLYGTGNPVDKMIFWARIPMILILILLGFYIFKWARELFGKKAALLALFLFSFSPTFLGHGRLVTTDVGAATGAFIATYYFIQALKNPSKKSIILAGISFGLAELCKFSVILLIPFFVFLAFIWSAMRTSSSFSPSPSPERGWTRWLIKSKKLLQTLKILILTFVIGYLLIWPVYQYHVWNYPPERQVRDTQFLLSSFKYPQIPNIVVWMADKPILRPYAQYGLGLIMAVQRVTGGNTTYFLGEVSAAGWKNYFPVVYSIKEPLTFHILTIIALLYAAWSMNIRSSSRRRDGRRSLLLRPSSPFTRFGWLIKKPFWRGFFKKLSDWLKSHFPEFAMLIFIGIYWLTSVTSDLNIGVRHLLPLFPFTMILVAGMISYFLTPPLLKMRCLLLGILIFWQLFSVVKIYPHFLAYFNELIEGPDKGYIYAVDSNLDWGQDLKRLKTWVDENNIDKIYVEYFGGGDAKYYLKEKFAPWRGNLSPEDFPKGNYLAVSATFLQGGRGIPVAGFNQSWGYYLWLNNYKPIVKIGYSIFIYYID